MKSARTLLKEYRTAGRTDAQIRELVADQPKEIRDRLLGYLEEEGKAPASRKRRAPRKTGVLLETEKITADRLPGAGLFNPEQVAESDLPPALPAAEEKLAPETEEVLAGREEEFAQDDARTITLVIEECIELNLEAAQPVEAEAAEAPCAQPTQESRQEMSPARHHLELSEVAWRSGIVEEIARSLEAEPFVCFDPRALTNAAAPRPSYLVDEEIAVDAQDDAQTIEEMVDDLMRSFPADQDADHEDIESDNEYAEEELPAYIPPELTVIECAGAPEEADPKIVQVQPSYALNPQQRAEALEKAENAAYYEIAQAIEADFKAMAQSLRAEDAGLVCADFDDIARPAELEWAPEPVIVCLEEDPAEAARTHAQADEELVRLRNWLNELEDGLKMKQIEQGNLMRELHDRDETLVAMGRQLANSSAVQEALREQSEAESIALARETNLITEQRARLQELHHENALLHRELARLEDCLVSNHTIIAGQSEQTTRLREQIDEMNHGIGGLLSHNRQVEAVLAQRERELENLRARLRQQNEMLVQHADERRANERISSEFEQLQREYNIIVNETIPDLQADKEELVCLVGEESARSEEFELLAARRARRLSYSTVIAAAACLFVVLSPLLAWHNQEIDRMNQEAASVTRLAQAESVRDALQAERNDLRVRLEAVKAEFSQAREQWGSKLAQLTTPQGAENLEAVASARSVNTTGGPVDPTTFDMQAQDSPVASAGEADKTHYNGVVGVDAWRVTQNQKSPAEKTVAENRAEPVKSGEIAKTAQSGKKDDVPTAEEKFSTVQVRRGEGLSQVLWRVYGSSSAEMVKHVTKLNNLSTDKRGHPMLRLDQELKLPVNPRTAMVSD